MKKKRKKGQIKTSEKKKKHNLEAILCTGIMLLVMGSLIIYILINIIINVTEKVSNKVDDIVSDNKLATITSKEVETILRNNDFIIECHNEKNEIKRICEATNNLVANETYEIEINIKEFDKEINTKEYYKKVSGKKQIGVEETLQIKRQEQENIVIKNIRSKKLIVEFRSNINNEKTINNIIEQIEKKAK